MKKKLALSCFAFIFGLLAKMAISTYQQKNTKRYTPHLNNLLFLQKSADSVSKNTTVCIFSPDCEHCKYFAEDLYAHRAELTDQKFTLATTASVEETKAFIQQNKLDEISSLNVGIDTGNFLYDSYHYSSIPSIYCFDKNNNLIFQHNGEMSVKLLLKKLACDN